MQLIKTVKTHYDTSQKILLMEVMLCGSRRDYFGVLGGWGGVQEGVVEQMWRCCAVCLFHLAWLELVSSKAANGNANCIRILHFLPVRGS